MQRLGDGVLLLPTAPQPLRNGDVHQPYRPGSSFHYLTGFPEPEAVLLIARQGKEIQTTLFVLPKDKAREIWDGRRFGPAQAKKKFGVDRALPLGELDAELAELLDAHDTVFHTLGSRPEWDRRLEAQFSRRWQRTRRRNPARHPAIVDPLPALNELRTIKDRHEIAALRRAADVSAAGHSVAMAIARPGAHEYEVQAEMEAVFRRGGSIRNGYESIVASGANACILHYIANDRRMKDGELLLIDAGAEVDGYTADITRTFPVGGTFSEPQRQVYEIVLEAQLAGIEAAVPGAPWSAAHDACVKVLCKGLIKLGVVDGPLRTALKEKRYRPYYMHGTSHWLGRDVHDVGAYEDAEGKPVPLAPGMVLTIEPGLYFGPKDRKLPAELRGIGVRIEDDVLVTKTGNDVLTAGVPKAVDEVEALCAGG